MVKPKIGMKMKPTWKEWLHVALVAAAVIAAVLLIERGCK